MFYSEKDLLLNEYVNKHSEFGSFVLKHWIEKEFLTYQWWFLLLLVVASWIIWWKLVDKTRLETILLYGLFWGITALTHNLYLGLIFGCWVYPINLSPTSSILNPINFAALPVIFMLIFQYCLTWKSFCIANIGIAALAAFVAEPLFVLNKIYLLVRWNYLYSFVLYIVIGIFLRWLVLEVKKVQGR